MSNKKGQTSVEYMLMIALVASLIFGLVAFSGVLEKKVAAWKFGARNKLAGIEPGTETYDLSRSDFKMGPPPERGGGGGATAGGGGGAGGRGRRGRGGAGGGGAEGEDMEGMGVTAPPAGAGTARTGGEGGAGTGQGASQYETEETSRQEAPATGYAVEGERQGTAGGEAGAAGAEGEEGGEAAGEEASLVKRQQEGLGAAPPKTLAERDWSIGKILIILAIVFFFIIVILKARQAKD